MPKNNQLPVKSNPPKPKPVPTPTPRPAPSQGQTVSKGNKSKYNHPTST